MKNKNITFRPYIWILLIILAVTSCSRINKAADFITKPAPKDVYKRQFKEALQLYSLWEDQGQKALTDSVRISAPYAESGKFSPQSFPVYSYDIALNPGEEIVLDIMTDSIKTLVFIDLYRQNKDSVVSFEHMGSSEFESRSFRKEIDQSGIYKIIMQPEIEANTPFRLKVHKESVYRFPVASKGNSAIQSFWGAARDGGRRSHEGIDIFAARGTPVVAATKGRVTSTGNKGLGGKQVWLRDSKRGNSLYYAHLDSIIATPGMAVAAGDTLGFVGNTGNARTAAPHLHFGIYKGFRGAINPLPFVYRNDAAVVPDIDPNIFSDQVVLSKVRANLRSGPTTKSNILKQIQPKDTLRLLGKSSDWYHIRFNEKNSFIHESLVSPVGI